MNEIWEEFDMTMDFVQILLSYLYDLIELLNDYDWLLLDELEYYVNVD